MIYIPLISFSICTGQFLLDTIIKTDAEINLVVPLTKAIGLIDINLGNDNKDNNINGLDPN